MKMPTRMWVYDPKLARKNNRGKMEELLKREIETKAKALVEIDLKPTHIKPPPKDCQWNWLTDIYTKWYRHYFYFCARYDCYGENVLMPFFETKFARLEFIGDKKFALAFMRHTDEWVEIYDALTLDECFEAIKTDNWFQP